MNQPENHTSKPAPKVTPMMAQYLAIKAELPQTLLFYRMSEKTLKQTLKWQTLMGGAYAGFTHVCAQSETDAQRYRAIGVVDAQLTVTGNLKFDMHIPLEQVAEGERIKGLLTNTRVVMLASSREGEEQLWLDAIAEFERTHAQTEKTQPRIQWWIVPRHPQRFDEVMTLLKNTGKNVVRKSELDMQPITQQINALAQADMVLGDTMGEMFTYYAIADLVLMGGTWLPCGGQNFLEPMALGKPVWVGASIYNFEQIGVDALRRGVLWQASNPTEVLKRVLQPAWHTVDVQILIKAFISQQCGVIAKLNVLLFQM